MPRLLTRRCPECGGEGWVPTKRCGHIGCCPCVEGIGGCETCDGGGEVTVSCGNCREPLEVGEVDECRACKEALEGDEMNAKQIVEGCERAMRALRGVNAHIVVFPGNSDTVREAARIWSAEVEEYANPPGQQGQRIVSVHRTVEGVTVGIQTTEAIPPPPECDWCGEPAATGHDWCPKCEAAGKCVRCGDPCLEALGYAPRDGYCGYCQDDDGDKAKVKRALTEDLRSDVLRDERKDRVGA